MRPLPFPGPLLRGLLAASLFLPRVLPAQQVPAADTLTEQFLALVQAGSPELAAGRAAAGVAEARLRAAGVSDAPVLSAELEDIPDGVNLPKAGQFRLMIEQGLRTGGRRSAERQAARVRRDAAVARLTLLEQVVRVRAERDLGAWGGWQAVARRLAAEDSLLTEAEAALRTRFAAGEARYVDVLRLRTERLRVQGDRTLALREAQERRRRLEGLVADRPETLAMLRLLLARRRDAPRFPPPPPDVEALLAGAGAVRLAEFRVEAARAEAGRVAADGRARLAGGLGLQRFGDPDGGFQVGPSLRASLSLPFAVGGHRRALATAAGLAVTSAEAARGAATARLRTTLLIARDRYEAELARVRVYDEALLSGVREEREGALAAYRSGDLSLLELLDFERALSRAETGRLRALIEAGGAYADLLTTAAGSPANDTLTGNEVQDD